VFYAENVDIEKSLTQLFIKITDETYSDILQIYVF